MINFEGNLNLLFVIVIIDDFNDSSIVPPSKIIFTVNNITRFQVFPPLKTVGFRFIWGNLNAIGLKNNFFVIHIVEIGNLNFIIFFFNNLSSRPSNFAVQTFRFEDINIVSNLEFFSYIIFDVKIVEGLNYKKKYIRLL